ncbi:hypothetical protein BPOR_0384g00100 [Botrytis porri]|uniref:Uncharacterized protein n=1 Tax=Botrytis porri TaxID=87229 RepID=A0A4Z1KHJ7_9HELO|nr:hypothetical protein BPOR_0384g00100 [Botrytis porri]
MHVDAHARLLATGIAGFEPVLEVHDKEEEDLFQPILATISVMSIKVKPRQTEPAQPRCPMI